MEALSRLFDRAVEIVSYLPTGLGVPIFIIGIIVYFLLVAALYLAPIWIPWALLAYAKRRKRRAQLARMERNGLKFDQCYVRSAIALAVDLKRRELAMATKGGTTVIPVEEILSANYSAGDKGGCTAKVELRRAGLPLINVKQSVGGAEDLENVIGAINLMRKECDEEKAADNDTVESAGSMAEGESGLKATQDLAAAIRELTVVLQRMELRSTKPKLTVVLPQSSPTSHIEPS